MIYRDVLLLHLAQAERHITRGDVLLAKQEDMIAWLDQKGYDTERQRAVLGTFRHFQSLHLRERSRILGTLERLELVADDDG